MKGDKEFGKKTAKYFIGAVIVFTLILWGFK